MGAHLLHSGDLGLTVDRAGVEVGLGGSRSVLGSMPSRGPQRLGEIGLPSRLLPMDGAGILISCSRPSGNVAQRSNGAIHQSRWAWAWAWSNRSAEATAQAFLPGCLRCLVCCRLRLSSLPLQPPHESSVPTRHTQYIARSLCVFVVHAQRPGRPWTCTHGFWALCPGPDVVTVRGVAPTSSIAPTHSLARLLPFSTRQISGTNSVVTAGSSINRWRCSYPGAEEARDAMGRSETDTASIPTTARLLALKHGFSIYREPFGLLETGQRPDWGLGFELIAKRPAAMRGGLATPPWGTCTNCTDHQELTTDNGQFTAVAAAVAICFKVRVESGTRNLGLSKVPRSLLAVGTRCALPGPAPCATRANRETQEPGPRSTIAQWRRSQVPRLRPAFPWLRGDSQPPCSAHHAWRGWTGIPRGRAAAGGPGPGAHGGVSPCICS